MWVQKGTNYQSFGWRKQRSGKLFFVPDISDPVLYLGFFGLVQLNEFQRVLKEEFFVDEIDLELMVCRR